MKKLLLLLSLIPLATFCQNTDTTNTKKISFGFTFSPDYCYRTLKADASSKSIADSRDALEIPKFGYTTGINFALDINKRITVEMGFLLSDKGEKTKTYFPNWITPSGQVDPALPTKITSNYHYYYLDIPLKVNYLLLTQRVKIFLMAGISPTIFLTQRTTSEYEYNNGQTSKNSSFENAGFERINLTFISGIGFGCDLTKKLHIKIEPTYRHSITTIVNAPIKAYLYSVGLSTGLYYNL